MKEMFPGKMTISRITQRGEEVISFSLQDDGSGEHVIEIEMDLADFARVITNFGHQPCMFRLMGGVKYVGLKREVKTEKVFVPDVPYSEMDKVAAEAVAKHETDGWKGRKADARNQHYRLGKATVDGVKGTYYSVTFTRLVDKEGNPVE